MGNSQSIEDGDDDFNLGPSAFHKLAYLFGILRTSLICLEETFETQDDQFKFYAMKSMKTLVGSPFGTKSFFWIHLRNVIQYMLEHEEEKEVLVVSKYLKILIFEIIKMHPNFFHMRENVQVNFFENTPSAKHGVLSVKPPIWLLKKYIDKCVGKKQECLVELLEIVVSFGPDKDKTGADADAVQHGAACTDADQHVAACTDAVQHVAACTDAVQPVAACTDAVQHGAADADAVQPVAACTDADQPVAACTDAVQSGAADADAD